MFRAVFLTLHVQDYGAISSPLKLETKAFNVCIRPLHFLASVYSWFFDAKKLVIDVNKPLDLDKKLRYDDTGTSLIRLDVDWI